MVISVVVKLFIILELQMVVIMIIMQVMIVFD